MKVFSKYYRSSYLVVLLILMFIYFGATMCNFSTKKDDKKANVIYGPNKNYIGSASCMNCHKEYYDSYLKAHHYNTSSLINKGIIAKQHPGIDSIFYSDNLFVTVQQKADGFYQTAYSRGLEAASHRIDIVFGSGKKGQTFLTWSDSSLYQLPLSWSSESNRWINSPGYPRDKALFNRMIHVKCFECHATYAEQRVDEYNKTIYDSSRMVLSISCESCHGPGAKHVEYHIKNPADKKPAFIINSATLSRQQKLDACASCHSGLRENLQPAFSFLTGNKLNDFFKPADDSIYKTKLDVHGNQYGLLTASTCFKQSLTLNCSSCHNTHQDETNKMEVFAQRCMNCHNDASHNFCRVKNTDRQTLISNCINCHMPMKPTAQIVFNTSEKGKKELLNESIRTHLIAIYPPVKTETLKSKIK